MTLYLSSKSKGAAHLFARTALAASLLILLILFWACDPPGGDKKPESPFHASVLARKSNDVRTSFGVFSVATGSAAAGDYLLGVSDTKPDSTDFTGDGVFERNLSGTAINVYIPIHIGATLPTALTSVEKDTANLLTAAMLSPGTPYTLYARPKSGGTVETLLTFTTDATPTSFSGTFTNYPPDYEYTAQGSERLVLHYYYNDTTDSTLYVNNSAKVLFFSPLGSGFVPSGPTVNYSVAAASGSTPDLISLTINRLSATGNLRIRVNNDVDSSKNFAFTLKRQ